MTGFTGIKVETSPESEVSGAEILSAGLSARQSWPSRQMNGAHSASCFLFLFLSPDFLAVFVLLGPSGSGVRPMMSLGSMPVAEGGGTRPPLDVVPGAAEDSHSISVPSTRGLRSKLVKSVVSPGW